MHLISIANSLICRKLMLLNKNCWAWGCDSEILISLMLMQKLISILKTFWLFLNLYCLLYLCKRISHQLRLTNYLGRFVLIPVSIKSYVSLMHDFRYFMFGTSLLYFMLYLLTFLCQKCQQAPSLYAFVIAMPYLFF